jgi:hypothetical protein
MRSKRLRINNKKLCIKTGLSDKIQGALRQQIALILAACLALLLPSMSHAARAQPNLHLPTITTYPQNQDLYDQYRFAGMYYYGVTTSDALGSMFAGTIHRWPEHIQSVELSYTLCKENWLRHLVYPLVGVVQVAGNFTVRSGTNEHTIYEFDPYVLGRWANFPWNKYVNTSFAIGEGISYDTSVPSLEKKSSANTKRLLNYLMLEATLALPKNPRWQLVVRIHHRSGAFGLYHAGNTGSNVIGLGIRYLFD